MRDQNSRHRRATSHVPKQRRKGRAKCNAANDRETSQGTEYIYGQTHAGLTTGIPLKVAVAKRKRKLPVFKHHRDKNDLDKLFPHLRLLQKLAVKHGIPDVFQDNGGKYLQLALVTGLTLLKPREGNDAVDQTGRQYEIKTLNIDRVTSFTTHHHLNPTIIAKYRKVDWVFAVYRGIELEAVYYMPVERLEHFFIKWTEKWNVDGRDINNPQSKDSTQVCDTKWPQDFSSRSGASFDPAQLSDISTVYEKTAEVFSAVY